MKVYKGITGAPGIVSGKVIYYEKKNGGGKLCSIDEAVEKASSRLDKLMEKANAEFGEDKAKIFSAYKMLLEDPMLTEPIKAEIDGGKEPAAAISDISESMATILASKGNEYMRQRADDIRYIGKILTDAVLGTESDFSFPEGEDKYIIAAHELTPVDTMLFDRKRLAGFITEKGGATSHTVILAKSIGIPAVVGAEGIKAVDGLEAYLDGYSGVLAADAKGGDREKYEELLNSERELEARLEQIKSSDAYSADRERIKVAVNIGKPSDLKDADGERFDGVGLFRTEFLYSSSDKKPTEKEQKKAYESVMKNVYPDTVTIRTIDVGGDKQLEYLGMKKEENPFLGMRGIRLCLNNTDIFSEQLRAIIEAGAGREVKIMLPMVCLTEEIDKTRELIKKIIKELKDEGKECCESVLLGIMIETPASAVMADVFAHHCDFFSIGTNDLVQYVTAADRGNADVENVYNPYHPAVIRLLNHVIKSGAENKIEVSVCGDLAANTDFTEVLLGMGLKKLSVPIPMVSRIKYKISTIDINAAKETAKKALSAENENEVRKILRKEEN